MMKRMQERKEKSNKRMHSYMHDVTRQVCEWVGQIDKFKMWMGITKRIGDAKMKNLLDYVKERGIRDPKYLMACTRTHKDGKHK